MVDSHAGHRFRRLANHTKDMKDNENETPRFSFGPARIQEDNKEYGDEAAQEFALLNGTIPDKRDRMFRIPLAEMSVNIAFPATARFEEMARYMERVRRLLQSEARALWSAGAAAE